MGPTVIVTGCATAAPADSAAGLVTLVAAAKRTSAPSVRHVLAIFAATAPATFLVTACAPTTISEEEADQLASQITAIGGKITSADVVVVPLTLGKDLSVIVDYDSHKLSGDDLDAVARLVAGAVRGDEYVYVNISFQQAGSMGTDPTSAVGATALPSQVTSTGRLIIKPADLRRWAGV